MYEKDPNVSTANGDEARRIANERAQNGGDHYVFQSRKTGHYVITVNPRLGITEEIRNEWERIYSVSYEGRDVEKVTLELYETLKGIVNADPPYTQGELVENCIPVLDRAYEAGVRGNGEQ